ncbi:hypothetical protein M758_2G215800, partial [Ceratodon purpureus]
IFATEFAYHFLWRTTVQWVIDRLFEEAYPLLGQLDADSVAKQVIQRPESPLKQARTDSVPTSLASLPRRTLSAAPLHTRVCALRTHICACEDSLQRQRRLCFPHTHDIALL